MGGLVELCCDTWGGGLQGYLVELCPYQEIYDCFMACGYGLPG